MQMFKHDFKMNFKSFIICTLAASLLAFLSVSAYSSTIQSNADQWNEMTQTLPKAFLDAFQVSITSFDDVLSFYAIKGYLFVTLILTVYMSMLGSNLINKEESEKTIEFALTKPISRFNYLTQKLVTLIIIATLANIIFTIILYLGILIGDNGSFNIYDFILCSIGTYLITLTFGLISFTIACVMKRRRGLTGISIGIVLISFFLGILSNITDSLNNFQYLSLFEYMNPNDLISNGISYLSICVFAIIIIISIIVSYRSYLTKDIYN